jgi:membrane associated rhomboid family serine protease
MGRIDPFIFLYCLEGLSHACKMPRVPKITGSVVTFTAILHAARSYFGQGLSSHGLLSVFDYGLVPEWTWKNFGLTSSMVISPFLHNSIGELATHLVPFLTSGATLENVLNKSTYISILSFSVIIPNVLLVFLTKLSTYMPSISVESRQERRRKMFKPITHIPLSISRYS